MSGVLHASTTSWHKQLLWQQEKEQGTLLEKICHHTIMVTCWWESWPHVTEKAVVSQYAEVHGATPAAVGQEISTNRLCTTFQGKLSSDSSTGAIKMALWRKKTDIGPKIPSKVSSRNYLSHNYEKLCVTLSFTYRGALRKITCWLLIWNKV